MDTEKSIPIPQLSDEDKPREKMLLNGKKTLSNSELIAILLRTGMKGRSALDVAKDILLEYDNNLGELTKLEVSDLTRKFKSIGQAKAISLLAAFELGLRMAEGINQNREYIIHNSNDLFNYIKTKIIDLPNEEFWSIYLNARNKVVGAKQIGVGGLTQTSVDLRLIFKGALECNAVAVAIAHNHPSGSITPSQVDKDLTQKIALAGDVMRIKLIEHLVVGIDEYGRQQYYSFVDHGIL